MNMLYRALKSEAVAMLAATLMALGLFSGLDNFLDFCQWLQPFVYYWKYYVHAIVDLLFIWLPVDLPNSVKDLFALAFLSASIMIRVSSQEQRLMNPDSEEIPEEVVKRLAFYRKTAVGTTGFVAIVFLFPVFGWSPVTQRAENGITGLLDYSGAYLEPFIRAILVSIVLGIVYFSTGSPSRHAITGLFGKYMFRVSAIFLTLMVINEIGLRYEDLENWREFQPPVETR